MSLPEAPITRRVKVTVSSVLTSAQELKLYAGSGVTFTATEALGIVSLTISASGSGSSDHATLTHLAWTASAHTGTASRVAGFDGAGAAAYYTIGSDLQAWDADLDAVAALATTGLAVRTGAGTWTTRVMTAPAAGLTITNPGGVSGSPTFALADDLAALEALTGTGYAKRTGTSAWSTSATVPWSDVGSTPTTLSGYGITDAASTRVYEGNAHALSTSTYTGLKAWRQELDGRGLWCLSPMGLGSTIIETISNAKTTSPAGRTRANDTKVTASDLGVTDTSGLTVTIDTSTTYDYSTASKTAPYQYISQPNFGRWRQHARVVARVKCPAASTGTFLFGIIVVNSANTNSYMRLAVGAISSAATGYSEYGTSGVQFTLTNAQITAGVWLRVLFNYDGSVTSQWSTSTATTEAAVTGWTTQQTSGSGLMSFMGSVYVGMLQLRAATGTPATLTGTYVYYDDSTCVSEIHDTAEPMGLGAPATRANAKAPIVVVDTGRSTATCASIADLRASITAACNRRPYDVATLRFSYQTYSSLGAVSAPADGDASWVALASISSLAAPSAGAVHVLWVDAASTSGAQSASIDLGAIRLPVSA